MSPMGIGQSGHRDRELAGLGICLVGINFAPDSTGIAPYNTAMARAFERAGAAVSVVTGVPYYPEWRIKDSRYTTGSRWQEQFDGIPVTRVRHHVPSGSTLSGRGLMEASFLARAVSSVRTLRSDVVVAVTPSLAGLAAGVYGRRGRPLGVLVQDLTGNAAGESGTTGGRAARTIAGYEYSLLRKAQRVGVIAPQFATVLAQHGVHSEHLLSLPNFTHITPVQASTAQARARLGWPAEGYTVVHTGNMGMKQGLEHVVAAARLSERNGLGIRFVLVGDGNQRAGLESEAQGLSTLMFVDPLDSDDYPFALAAADALLLNERPGVREMSLPSKLTSYASANRPIIAAVEDGGITRSVIETDGAGLIVEPGRPERIVDAALKLRSEPARARAFADAALDMYSQRYGSSAALARYVAFARELGNLV